MRWIHVLGIGLVVGLLAFGVMLASMGFLWQERAFPAETLTSAGPAGEPATQGNARPVGAGTAVAAAKPGGSSSGATSAGQTVFQQNCNGCHPGGNKGVGPQLKGGNVPPERIRQMVRNGGGAMPAFPPTQVTEQQLSDLVAYVQSLR